MESADEYYDAWLAEGFDIQDVEKYRNESPIKEESLHDYLYRL